MSAALQTVLEIAGIGTTLLFLALFGLVGLMYGLTSSWLAERVYPVEADDTEEAAAARRLEASEQADEAAAAERDRQRQAVALAVAVAGAAVDRPMVRATGPVSAWRRLQRTRRLVQPRQRLRGRS